MLLLILFGSIYVDILDKSYDRKYDAVLNDVEIKAVVITEPEEKEYKYIYTIKVKSINCENKYNNTKLILNVKKKEETKQIPAFGDEILITGNIESPKGARNYKGFDYRQYLKSKGIYGTVNVNKLTITGKNKVNFIEKFLNLVQNNMKKSLNNILKEDEAALCIGILVGVRTDISKKIEENFKTSNLTHMLAVSGSHITYIINGFALLLSKTGKRFSKVFTIIILIFFMALTGFTASVIRATLMGILILLGSLLHRKSDTINNLGISAFIILLCNPYTLLYLGFLLSYAGTIGIIFLGNKVTNKMYEIINHISKGKINLEGSDEVIHDNCSSLAGEIEKSKVERKKNDGQLNPEKQNNFIKIIFSTIKYLVDSLSITLSANIIIIPVMAYFFSTTSFTFWISNILAGPVMEITTIFGFIVYFISLVCMPLAQILGIFLNLLLSILIKIAEFSAIIPGASIYIKTPYLITCIMYYLIIFAIIKKKEISTWLHGNKYTRKILDGFKKNKNKVIMTSLICVILIVFVNITIPKDLRIYFVDVGQGDCCLIKTPTNKNILIDGGGSEFGSFDVGESILLPYLLDRRVTKIDYLMISHFDSDHIGGLFTIMENLKVKNIIIPEQGKDSQNLQKFKKIVKDNDTNVLVAQKGDYIKIDKYSYFEILFPEQNLISENILNNNSLVAQFNCKGMKMLFTGDIEAIAENRLIEMYGNSKKLDATVLKTAHHGSKSSSTAQFLELVNPKIVFIGVGEDNKFGHPNNGVLERLGKYINKIYRTDKNGEIELLYKNGKIKINTIY